MSRPGESLNALMSYTRFDDQYDGHALTELRKELSNEIRSQLGDPFDIFQDTEHLRWGEDWEIRLRQVLAQYTFLIPIITPNYLSSRWCRRELLLFSQRKGVLSPARIFPVYYITAHGFEPSSESSRHDDVVKILRKSNWVDWRPLRAVERKDPERMAVLRKAARDLVETALSLRQDSFSERSEEASRLMSVGLINVVTSPGDALTVLDQLLRYYQDAPLVYVLIGTILRARALVNLGEPKAAQEQLEVFLEGVERNFPGGAMQDPVMAKHVKFHVAVAKQLRDALVTGDWSRWGSEPPRV